MSDAAGRLRILLAHEPDLVRDLDEALAAERKATVERIQAALVGKVISDLWITRILDAEAER